MTAHPATGNNKKRTVLHKQFGEEQQQGAPNIRVHATAIAMGCEEQTAVRPDSPFGHPVLLNTALYVCKHGLSISLPHKVVGSAACVSMLDMLHKSFEDTSISRARTENRTQDRFD